MTRSNPTSTTNRCFTCGSCILLHVHASLRLFRHRPLLRFSVPHFLQHRLQLNHLNGRLGVFCGVFARAFTLPRQNTCFWSRKKKNKNKTNMSTIHVNIVELFCQTTRAQYSSRCMYLFLFQRRHCCVCRRQGFFHRRQGRVCRLWRNQRTTTVKR